MCARFGSAPFSRRNLTTSVDPRYVDPLPYIAKNSGVALGMWQRTEMAIRMLKLFIASNQMKFYIVRN
jgi:hypothetical protein